MAEVVVGGLVGIRREIKQMRREFEEKVTKRVEKNTESMKTLDERMNGCEYRRNIKVERSKKLENKFIDEFPELSLQEVKKMSWKLAHIEVEW